MFSSLPLGFGGFFLAATLFGLVLGLIPASIAQRKGYSFALFWIFGIFLFIPALIVAVLIQDHRGQGYGGGAFGAPPRGLCRRCGESVPAAAAVCRFCGQDLPVAYATQSPY